MSEKSVAEFHDVISGLQQVKATLATICRAVENGETDPRGCRREGAAEVGVGFWSVWGSCRAHPTSEYQNNPLDSHRPDNYRDDRLI